MRGRGTLSSWLVFTVLLLIGLVVAIPLYAGLAMGDCLPRDGSAEMTACDGAKAREFWLYPLLVLLTTLWAAWLEARGSQGGRVVAAFSGLAAFFALLFIEWAAFLLG